MECSDLFVKMVIIMSVFILIVFIAVAAACFIMIQRLEKLKDETHSEDKTSVIKIALEDMSAAASLCEKLEPVSKKIPSLQFCFYTGNYGEIVDFTENGKIDFGILSSEPSEVKSHWTAALFMSEKIDLTGYDITAEPLCPQLKKLYILFSPEELDEIKSEILNTVIS